MVTMKIEIDAHRLLEILTDAGIPDNDAKSLIFDILSDQHGIAVKKKEISTLSGEVIDNEFQEEVEEEEETPNIKTTRISFQNNQLSAKPAVNFSNFGGDFAGMGKK